MEQLLRKLTARRARPLELCETCGVCDARCRARRLREAARTRAATAGGLLW